MEKQRVRDLENREEEVRKKEGKRVSFATKWDAMDDGTEFSFFESDPEEAALLCCANSGTGRFKDVDNIDDSDPGVADTARRKVEEEMDKEAPTAEHEHELMGEFYKKMGIFGFGRVAAPSDGESLHRNAPIKTCACCGVKDMERADCEYFEEPLGVVMHGEGHCKCREEEEEFDFFGEIKLTDQEMEEHEHVKEHPPLRLPCNDNGDARDFYLHEAWNVFECDGEYCWLHEQFVIKNIDGTVQVPCCEDCCNCLKGKKTPAHCLARVNFGSAECMGLVPLRLTERMMTAMVRHHFCVIKTKSNTRICSDGQQSAINGHCILFAHDAPDQTLNALDGFSFIENNVKLHFIGTEKEMDTLMKMTLGTHLVGGRAFAVCQYLSVLSHLNPACWDVEVPTFEYFKERMAAVEKHLVDTACKTVDERIAANEDEIGDDVGQVRTTTAVRTRRVRKVVTTTRSVVPDDDARGDDDDDEVGSHLGSTEWRLLDPCASHGEKFCPLQIGETIAMPQGMVELPSECIMGSRIKRMVRHKWIEPVDEKK